MNGIDTLDEATRQTIADIHVSADAARDRDQRKERLAIAVQIAAGLSANSAYALQTPVTMIADESLELADALIARSRQ